MAKGKERTYIFIGLLVAGSAAAYFLTRKKPDVALATPAEVDAIREEKKLTTQDKLKAMASKQLRIPESELVVRSLRPEDLGSSSSAFSFPIATANAWNNIISTNVSDNRFIAITGVVYTGSIITQLRIVAAGSTKEIWNVQAIPSMETPRYVDLTPTAIQQNQMLAIDVYATNTSAGESLVFEGIVVERKGLVIA